MKKIILLLLFIPLVSFGQKSNDADALKLCVALQSNNFTTDVEAEDAVNKILSVIGASQKPVLQACSNINNAVAAVYKGQRYILYDRDFMNSLTAGSNKYWSNMFILAHEVGHHINGHSLDIILYANDVIDPKSLEERRKQELEADEFAGFVLAKLGASLSQTSKVLSNLPRISNENSSTHPSKYKRISSVKVGYKKGEIPNKGSIKSTKTNNTKPIIKYSSKWKSVTEYPKKESNNGIVNPIDLVKNFDGNLYDLKNTSTVEGDLFDDISKNWPVKKIITKPTLIIKQFKDYKSKYLGYNDTENRTLPHNNTEIIIKNFADIEMFLELYDRVFFIVDFVVDGERFCAWSFSPKNNRYMSEINENNEYRVSLRCMSRNYETNYKVFLQKLKKADKLYMRLSAIRVDSNSDMMEVFNDCAIYEEACFNTYEFDLKGSSKALSF